jgi:FkbM family methyltransferase
MRSIVSILQEFEIAYSSSKRIQARIARHLLSKILRQCGIPQSDPIVSRTVHGVELFMPFSHQLPAYVEKFPYFDTPLPAFAKFLCEEVAGQLIFVDVGANVGDTVKLVSKGIDESRVGWICIEADESYLSLLKRNTDGLDVTIINAVAGANAREDELSIVQSGQGSSVIVSGGNKRRIVCLDDILEQRKASLIKIDTDGYEIEVLKGASKYLQRASPHIFVEFSPTHLRKYGGVEPREMFALLKGYGYTGCIFYEYRGYPIAVTGLGERISESIMRFCEINPFVYMDLLVSKDTEMLNKFYESDLKRYRLA